MRYEIRLHPNAISALDKLNQSTKERLIAKIRVLKDRPKLKQAGADIKRNVCFQPFHGVVHVRDNILAKIFAVDYMGFGRPSETSTGNCCVKIESCRFSGKEENTSVFHKQSSSLSLCHTKVCENLLAGKV